MDEPDPSVPGPRAAGPSAIPQFPLAPQPSIIRAQQKDEAYVEQLTEACHDAVRRLLGPRRALLWARETRLLAELLYHALTTGSGSQTLGEEYCELVQATSRGGTPPGTLRRGALVLLQSLGPYLSEKALTPANAELQAWQAARRAAARPAAQHQSAGRAALLWWEGLMQRAAAAGEAFKARSAVVLGPRAVSGVAQARRFVSDNGAALLRLHLAVFYTTGVYFQLPKRLAGVRLLAMGRVEGARPVYRALGAALLLQAFIAGGVWAARINPTAAAALKCAGIKLSLCDEKYGGTAGEGSRRQTQHAVLLRADGSEAVGAAEEESERSGAAGGGPRPLGRDEDVPQHRKCPLCLSQRAVPTATPCGHVFCWQCIAEWASQKPECPLCRSEVVPSALVVARHCDF